MTDKRKNIGKYVRTPEHKKMLSEIQKEIYKNGRHNNNNPIRNIDKVISMGKNWLETEYIINNRSMSSIATKLGVYAIDISKAMKYFGLPARSICNGKNKDEIKKSLTLLQNYDWLYKNYYTDQLAISYISSEILHLPSYKIKAQLEKFNIPIRTYSEQLSISRKKVFDTPENKQIISERFTNLWQDPKFIEKMSHRVFPKGKNHPNYGKKLSDEHKQKLCGRKWSGIGYKSQQYKKVDGSYIWLRSSYEVRVATILDKLGLNWVYEYKKFNIPELNTTYLPDFYIKDIDVWWEVKGYIDDIFKQKFNIFINTYNININIIRLSDIEYLESLPNNSDLYEIISAGNIDI